MCCDNPDSLMSFIISAIPPRLKSGAVAGETSRTHGSPAVRANWRIFSFQRIGAMYQSQTRTEITPIAADATNPERFDIICGGIGNREPTLPKHYNGQIIVELIFDRDHLHVVDSEGMISMLFI
jgi:hypothetical protein